MDHLEAIEVGLAGGRPHAEIARKLFLTYPTKVLIGDEERQFRILDAVSVRFGVPIMNIHVCGSAKTGRSFHKRTDFSPKNSDLDVAIIDARLFASCLEEGLRLSRGYSDQTRFPMRAGGSTFEEYRQYLARGIFRPDLMPVGPYRANWNDFFVALSNSHSDLFRSITAGVYLSQACFEQKQRSVIRNYLADRPI